MNALRTRSRVPHPLPAQRDISRHSGNVVGRGLRDAFYSLGDLGAVGGLVGALFLDVEVLRVLTNDDEVDGARGGESGLYGADIGVESEAFAEGDDGGGVAFYGFGRAPMVRGLGKRPYTSEQCNWSSHWRAWTRENLRDGAKQRTITIALQHIHRLVWQRNALLLERLEASIKVRKRELEAKAGRQRFEDATAGGYDFATDTVAGNEA